MRLPRAVRSWLLGDERRLAFYERDLRVDPGRPDADVIEWPPSPLPDPVRRPLGAGGNVVSAWLMLRRWRRRRIRCFVLMVDGVPAACGAIRAWSLHRRECGWLGRPGPVLASAWTHPAHRGKGLHGRLLAHRLHACAADGAQVVYTSADVDNTVSRRNIERAGFRLRGCVAIRRALFRLIVRVRPL